MCNARAVTVKTYAASSTYRDAIIIPIVDAFTSLFAGCVIFVTLGYVSDALKTGIDTVVSEGTLNLPNNGIYVTRFIFIALLQKFLQSILYNHFIQ